MRGKTVNFCCLCGKALETNATKDHVPPKQFFPSSLRKKGIPELITVRVHKSCNKRFERDEVYFLNTLGPLAMRTVAGSALMRDIFEQGKRPQGLRIVEMIRKEFTASPGGIHLPPGRVAKQFDGDRVRNVVWKIIRELFFVEKKMVLPEDTPVTFQFLANDDPAPPYLHLIDQQPSRDRCPSVFDFKYTQVPEVHNSHWWALLFWDKLIAIVVFHDPSSRRDVNDLVKE